MVASWIYRINAFQGDENFINMQETFNKHTCQQVTWHVTFLTISSENSLSSLYEKKTTGGFHNKLNLGSNIMNGWIEAILYTFKIHFLSYI